MTETSAPNPPEQAHLRGTTPAPPLEPSARADSRRQDVDSTTVALVTLGCARNEVDSEELAGRLAEDGFTLVDDAADADTVLVNTCGFVEAAKKDSVDELLAASDLKESGRTQKVVAVGCMAERYGKELAEALPEADAVLGFDDYPDIAARVRGLLDGDTHDAHTPVDRRTLLPITPVARAAAAESDGTVVPGHDWVPSVRRRRLTAGPYAPLKLASGCDRRCTFCAIPRFRGAYLSRPPEDLLAEARWLAEQGVKELFLVSENTTSYGKDLGDLRLLEKRVLPALAQIDGIERVRVSYLQPAEVRPGLIEAIATTDGVVPYFDLSFQHSSATVLRRMRRFGDTERFLSLIEQVRAANPAAGIRSNVIVGFPGETAADFTELCDFLEAARLDVVGVFGYSDEENTEAASYDDKIDADVISSRLDELSQLVEELTTQRAEDRVGESITVLVEQIDDDAIEGRADHQGPEVDGSTELVVGTGGPDVRIGDLVSATVVDSDGADLIAEPVEAE